MKTNNLLTYILYTLLGGLILIAGWKACELKKEKAQQARAAAEAVNPPTHNYEEDGDSLSSSYTESKSVYRDSSLEKPTQHSTGGGPKTSKSGIENDDTAEDRTAANTKTAATTSTKKSLTAPKPVVHDDDETDAPAPKRKTVSKGVSGSSKGKYGVVVGTFVSDDRTKRARAEMETLIKKHKFMDATIQDMGKEKKTYAIAKRTNSEDEAKKVLAQVKKIAGYEQARIVKFW